MPAVSASAWFAARRAMFACGNKVLKKEPWPERIAYLFLIKAEGMRMFRHPHFFYGYGRTPAYHGAQAFYGQEMGGRSSGNGTLEGTLDGNEIPEGALARNENTEAIGTGEEDVTPKFHYNAIEGRVAYKIGGIFVEVDETEWKSHFNMEASFEGAKYEIGYSLKDTSLEGPPLIGMIDLGACEIIVYNGIGYDLLFDDSELIPTNINGCEVMLIEDAVGMIENKLYLNARFCYNGYYWEVVTWPTRYYEEAGYDRSVFEALLIDIIRDGDKEQSIFEEFRRLEELRRSKKTS